MPRIWTNGREVTVPQNAEGTVDVQELRQAVGAHTGRMLILRRNSGQNMIVPKKGSVEINPYDHLMDAPKTVRG